MPKQRIVDPYSSELISDYNKYISDFHLEKFDAALFPEPNRIMK